VGENIPPAVLILEKEKFEDIRQIAQYDIWAA